MRQPESDKHLPIVWQPKERRSGRRLKVASRPVHIDHGSATASAICENISDRGMRLRLPASFDLNDACVIIFTADAWISGRVIWINGEECGISFDQPIDCALFVFDAAGHSGNLVAAAGTARSGQQFRPGLHVKIALSSGQERRGVLQWTTDEVASLVMLDN